MAQEYMKHEQETSSTSRVWQINDPMALDGVPSLQMQPNSPSFKLSKPWYHKHLIYYKLKDINW